ncbi:MAG: Uma2 family endonuclease [Bacteroidetes bacterium]|nr:MAG: Uma2 family endonuclease [Bacteroidota bacterium]
MNLSFEKRYTYADYLNWFDDKRREIINGFVKLMSPSPSLIHQEISSAIVSQMWLFLKDRQCKVFAAPFDVRFPINGSGKDDKSIYTVVQPDISVVCDMDKLDKKGCVGAPDLIVEIISPSTAKRDLHDKFQIYEQFGVKEYWVVYPLDKTISIFQLCKDGKYDEGTIFKIDSKIDSIVFPDFKIGLKEIFS